MIDSYVAKFEKEKKDAQLKWSCEYTNQTINEEMLETSKQVDECISKGLPIPKVSNPKIS